MATGVTGSLSAKLLPPRIHAMRRERLEASLGALWDHRLGLVIAPAGAGKTTLVGQFAAATDAPVAWYRADGHDGSAGRFLRYLERTLSAALDGLACGWSDVEEMVDALARWPGDRAVLVIDDLHLLEGTPAESTLARLVDDAPPSLAFLLAGRRPPRFNLPRLRVSGVAARDRRRRAPLPVLGGRAAVPRLLPGGLSAPTDLAALARRTEGWAAGLQLFHLATKGKPPPGATAGPASS